MDTEKNIDELNEAAAAPSEEAPAGTPDASPEGEGPCEVDWRADAEKYKDLCLRTQADMENMRKRLEREMEEFRKFANENLIRQLLPLLDNLERGLDHAPDGGPEVEGFVEGVRLTYENVQNTLEKFGVKRITAVGEPFDPNRHEAVMQREDPTVETNTVIEEVQRGYLLNERLLRPSMVIVSRRP